MVSMVWKQTKKYLLNELKLVKKSVISFWFELHFFMINPSILQPRKFTP